MDRLVCHSVSRREVHEAKGIPTSKHIEYGMVPSGSGVLIPPDYLDDISASGVTGDATLAAKEEGEKLIEVIRSRVVELVEDLGRKQLRMLPISLRCCPPSPKAGLLVNPTKSSILRRPHSAGGVLTSPLAKGMLHPL